MQSTSTGRDIDTATVSPHTLVKWSEHVVRRSAAETAQYVMREIDQRDQVRQVLEDERANHRNLNRMLTLFGALFIGLCLTWLFTHPQVFLAIGLPPTVIKTLAPYTFVITIFMDSSLAAYSFFKKY